MNLNATIEKTRRDLLELTARNRLVHTPLDGKRSGWISVCGKRSDEVFELLVRQTKSLRFVPAVIDVDANAETQSYELPEDSERQEFLRAFDEAEATDLDDLQEAKSEDVNSEIDESVESIKRHSDLFLQTKLEKDKLHDRLLRFYYDARTAEEEQGVSILYLACGFLKWQEASNSKVSRYAPLLLIPVELTRNNARSQFRLKFRDDEIVTNLSIQARLQQDFGIRIPDLPEAPQDDEAWTPAKYFEEIRELIQDRDGWELLDNEILLWFFSFTKFLMFRDLSHDAWPQGFELEKNGLICGLLGEGFPDVPCMQSSCGDDDPIDNLLSPADVIHVTDADSSQAIVIDEIAKGRNLVVQGPPGTGKSQTITNAIAAAVYAGKRVLFVSEKMAALEVVKRRLDNIGLGPMTLELHSHKARKREVLEELKTTLGLGIPTGTKTVPTEELRHTSNQLRQHDHSLHSPVGSSGCSPYQAMGRLLQLRASGRKSPSFQISKLTEQTPQDFQRLKQCANELDQLLVVSGCPQANPWYGVGCSPMLPADMERLRSKLQAWRTNIELLSDANVDLACKLGMSVPNNLLETSALAQLAAHVRKCPDWIDRQTLLASEWDSSGTQLRQLLTTVEERRQTLATIESKVHESAWDANWTDTRIALAAHGKSWFRFFNSDFRSAVAKLRGIYQGVPPKNADERVSLIDSILKVQKTTRELKEADELCRSLLGQLWQGVNTQTQPARAVIDWVDAGLAMPLAKQHAREIVSRLESTVCLEEPLERIGKLLKSVDQQTTDVVSLLRFDTEKSLRTKQPRQACLTDFITLIDRWHASPEQLSHYLATNVRIDRLRQEGLSEIADEVETGILKSGEVASQLELVRSEAVIAAAWRERPEIATFHGDTYEKLRERFAELDQQQIALSRLEVARKHHENLPSTAADSGQVGVVRHEVNKKRKHLSIRRLIQDAGHAIQKIKPVFMMSPLSVAQFLEPGSVEFDLLVIDEASQVQPVDALGAIARSHQIVVVGDQRQLPPTNFFGRVSGEELDDDDTESANVSDLESILGLCEAQGLPNRMLRWHYRSRHESLIAVSNRQFYDDRLFIVPSPIINGGPLGLKLRYVANGWYDRGGSRVNRNEAIAVAKAVMEHAIKRPSMSLGVATFSSAQRDAIIDELELLRRTDPSVEEFFGHSGPAPFFVKSLENVQGDERDVIFISIGYAKDKDGYFSQNFGPLNRKGGERRLNVLISRASAACEVFTSLKAADIDVSRSQSEGVIALKMYLNYAEHGLLDTSQSCGDADSVFEEQVAAALRKHGLEVDHQIGVGGFYIDLAIRDTNRCGRYLLGIECDGAQYHSARWVRDRDRLRLQILESRGWIIHRIWSTDWFQRPDEQLERTLAALSKARKHWDEVDQAESEAANVIAAKVPHRTDVGDEDVWVRVVKEDAVIEPKGFVGYQEAVVNLDGISGSPATLNMENFAKLVKAIVDIESPIHTDEIGRRCISILGQGRLVASLKTKIDNAVSLLESDNAVRRSGDFVLRGEKQQVHVRNRRELANANLRKLDYIAREELQAAVVMIIRENIGTDVDETTASVAKLLGISNGRQVRDVIAGIVDDLSKSATVFDRSGKLFIS